MNAKFKTNFKVVLPAAIIAIILYVVLGRGVSVTSATYSYNIIKIIPYVAILIAALMEINVILVLTGGIVLGTVVGFITKSLTLGTLFSSISTGILGMSETLIISIIIGGIVELVRVNGEIDFLLYNITKRIKTKRGAELGISALVSIADIATANNTIAILTVGSIAKNISEKYNLDSSRVAGILDMFSCVFQGLIPYGAQLLTAASLAGISPFTIMKNLFYPYLMGISAVIFIVFFNRGRDENTVKEVNQTEKDKKEDKVLTIQ